MMRKILWFISICFLCNTGAGAAELSLQGAFEKARDHSFQLKKTVVLSESSRSELKSARAERFPTLSLAAYASYISDIASLDIIIPPMISFSREIGTEEHYQSDLRLTLPLFTGGKISGGIGMAKAGVDYYDAAQQMETDRLYFTTRVTYLKLYRTERLVEATLASQKRTAIIMNDIESMYAAGAADSVAVLDARLALTRADYAVTQARSTRRTVEIEMLTLLGMDIMDSLTLTDNFSSPVMIEPLTALSEAKPELRAYRANIEHNRSRLKITRAEYFPTVSVFTGYSYGKPNIDQFNNTWSDYYTVGANLIWAFNIGGKSINKVRNAHYQLQSADYDYRRVEEDLTREMQIAYENLKNSYEKYLSAFKENIITTQSYRLAQEQHRQGAMATNRLLEIETTLTSSQASLTAAQVDFHIALSTYYYAAGSPQLREGN
ncbi:MAG: TolC family protein [Candidatus Zixiibacteriota bacterium]